MQPYTEKNGAGPQNADHYFCVDETHYLNFVQNKTQRHFYSIHQSTG